MNELPGKDGVNVRDRFDNRGRCVAGIEHSGLVDHRPARECAGVATTNQDPRSLTGCNVVTTRHRQLHVVRKVLEVVYCLLNRVQLQRLDGQVVIWVGIPIESVLDHDGRRILLLGDLAVDSRVCQVAIIA